MRKYFIFPLVAIGLVGAPTTMRQGVNAELGKLVDLLGDGIACEYPSFRAVKFGKLFQQGEDGVVALFSIEGFGGGNNNSEYLAIFEAVPRGGPARKKSKKYRLVAVTQIGGRWWRTFDNQSVVLGPSRVQISGKNWQPEDPGCCPSQAFTATFKIDQGKGMIDEAP